MSSYIPVAFVQTFSAAMQMLCAQEGTRLRNLVENAAGKGEAMAIERMGSTDAVTVTDRHGPTPEQDMVNTRRWVYPITKEVRADFFDQADASSLLVDPRGGYIRRHGEAMGRAIDAEILNAMSRSVKEGHAAATTTAYDTANQQIVSGSVGLTLSKLITARQKLNAAEVTDNNRYVVFTAADEMALLSNTEITNADYNTVKALVTGQVNSFLGFQFVRTELVETVSSERLCNAWQREGIRFHTWDEPTSETSPRPDRRNAWQVYTWGKFGAVRLEDVRVVQILCA